MLRPLDFSDLAAVPFEEKPVTLTTIDTHCALLLVDLQKGVVTLPLASS